MIDVKTIGAKGDGIQEDSTYINLAIDQALKTGQDVFIPSGTYKCNQFITGNTTTIKIAQSGIKKIKIYGEKGTKITTSNDSGSIMFFMYNLVDTTIQDIFFENTHDITLNQTNAIRCMGTGANLIKNLNIKNCRFEGFSTALSIQGVIGLNIIDNIFEAPKGHDNAQNNSSPAVFVWLFDNQNGQCYDVEIIGNNANGFTGTDINNTVTKRPMDGFVYGTAYGMLISNNITRNLCEEHIAIAPLTIYPNLNYPILISNNIFYQGIPSGCTKNNAPLISNYGVRTDCNNVTITDNVFFDFTCGVLVYGLDYPTLKQSNYMITNNKFYSPRNNMYKIYYAIKIAGSVNNLTSNVIILNNMFDIDNTTLNTNLTIIGLYNCERLNVENNYIFKKNIVLGSFTVSDIVINNSLDYISNNNIVRN